MFHKFFYDRKWTFSGKFHAPRLPEFFVTLAKYIPVNYFLVVCFFTSEQPGAVCPFHTDTGGKILRLLTAGKQSQYLIRDFKTRPNGLERLKSRIMFCFLCGGNLYTDFFQQCLYKKNILLPDVHF